jgi:hypothetical protein
MCGSGYLVKHCELKMRHRRRAWRVLAKALGEKATACDYESDRVAMVRVVILAAYMITNFFICAGVVRHWNS